MFSIGPRSITLDDFELLAIRSNFRKILRDFDSVVTH